MPTATQVINRRPARRAERHYPATITTVGTPYTVAVDPGAVTTHAQALTGATYTVGQRVLVLATQFGNFITGGADPTADPGGGATPAGFTWPAYWTQFTSSAMPQLLRLANLRIFTGGTVLMTSDFTSGTANVPTAGPDPADRPQQTITTPLTVISSTTGDIYGHGVLQIMAGTTLTWFLTASNGAANQTAFVFSPAIWTS